jgi:5-methylcytosine-specific restriction enzyme subunit McrC
VNSPDVNNRHIIKLAEQEPSVASLLPDEAVVLRDAKFQVVKTTAERETNHDRAPYLVNPGQYVGHFELSANTIVTIAPKVSTARIIRMLAYVYDFGDGDFFKDEDVHYSKDHLLFEPFVSLFADLTERRIRRGLFQDYIRREENLAVLKGRLLFNPHLRDNYLRRPERAFCAYYENTCDIEDNQIIRWTISRIPTALFSGPVARRLVANFHQMDPVSLLEPASNVFGRRHYHRLNDDYRRLHNLCRLLLDGCSFSEQVGDVRFRGFLIDMNVLFEKFVTNAFIKMGRKLPGMPLTIGSQDSTLLSQPGSIYRLKIKPDITVRAAEKLASIVDAKYKKAAGAYENHDFYQVISYATGLACPRTHLIYPATEQERDETIGIRETNITVGVHRIDLEDPNCVENAERVAESVLLEYSAELPN